MPVGGQFVKQNLLIVQKGQVSDLVFVSGDVLVGDDVECLLVADTSRAKGTHTLSWHVELGLNAVV